MSTISIVAAIADNNAIGKNRALLWHMPADMKRFKELTTGHAVIMGRKTFESLPKGGLPNRKNIVLTTLPEAGFVNCFACESMGAALDLCEKEEEIFIIGGGVSAAGSILMDPVVDAYRENVFSPARQATFALAQLGNNAGIYGGAGLFFYHA